jgi:hypothetical protein
MIADGSAALTDEGLWSVPEGRLRCPLPSDLRKSLRQSSVRLAAISPDGRTLVVLHNSGAANGRAALRAGNLTLVDIATGKARGRTGMLPYLSDVVRSADGVLAFAVHGTLDEQPGGELTLAAIDLARAEVVWRAALPREPHRARVRAWADGVVAFGSDWVGAWRGATGESLFGPASVLQDRPPDERPTRIADAYVLETPPHLFIAYWSGAPRITKVEIPSGKTVQTVGVRSVFRVQRDGGAIFLEWSPQGGMALWDSATLTQLGPLVGQKDLAAFPSVSFDASGRRVATAVGYGPLNQTHVVIWDVRTQRAVGQCLFNIDATGKGQLLADGRAVLAHGRAGTMLCEAPESDR